jgi:hypothetical protein
MKFFAPQTVLAAAWLVGAQQSLPAVLPEYGTAPVISEFLASNGSGLTDQFGLREDWIEIHNPTGAPLDLNGWYLTGSATNLTKWRFPAVTLPPGGHRVVFASNRNLRNPAQPLHTNFKLGAGGEYLALVMPDGQTVVSEYAPLYPPQVTDISYGLTPVPGDPVTLLAAGSLAEFSVPSGPPPVDWKLPGFVPEPGWFTGVSGLGFDLTPAASGGAKILFVVDEAAPAPAIAGDQSVRHRLTTILGHEVTTVYDGAVTAAHADGMDLVMVSSSVVASAVNTKLQDVPVPVVNWERGLTDEFLFSVQGSGSTPQTSVQLTTAGAAHPVGGGLPAGIRQVRDTAGTFNLADISNLAPDATVVATVDGGKPAIVVVEQGDRLRGNVIAPACRLHLFLDDAGVAPLTADGLALFDAAVVHALGDFVPPPVYEAFIGRDLGGEMHGEAATLLARFSFTPESVADLRSLVLKIRADDGYVAWLNGVEIARRNAPAAPEWDSVATAAGDALVVETVDVTAHLGLVLPGQANTLAIQGLNLGAADADLLILPELVAGTVTTTREEYFTSPTPGAANASSTLGLVPELAFSHDRGYFDQPFDLELSTAMPEATIRYTTDGSAPTATSGILYEGPIPITTTTTVRAYAYRAGYTSRRAETVSFLHLPDILQQPALVPGWPNPLISTGSGSRVHDYEMDPELLADEEFREETIEGFANIPTVSLVVKPQDMWNAAGDGGFYRGEDIERAASVEYINPSHPGENMQADCGMEGHSHDRLKRSLRLSFKSAFGEKKFDSALFTGVPWKGNSGHREVDNIILRAGNNHSFARSWNPTTSTYGEDEWYRATQIAMGRPGSPGRFVHLFINGLYWGLYNAVERPDAGFAANALGGAKEEWFSVNHGGVRGGDSGRWSYLTTDLIAKNMAVSANYAELAEYVDLPSFVDYLLCAFYSGMNDWPQNNWWGGNRNQPAGPFHYFAWDGETAWGAGNGANTTAWVHPAFRSSNPINNEAPAVRIWHAARQNPDFVSLVADRLHKHLSPGGALSTAEAVDRWDRIHQHIEDAIHAESARWGDTMQEPPSRPAVEWQAEVDRVRRIMLTGTPDASGTVENAALLKNAMRQQGYFPIIEAPAFSQEGGTVAVGFQLEMTNPNPAGILYFTLDGTDPRESGGSVAPSALVYSGPLEIPYSLTVKARVKQGQVWSALHERYFVSSGTPPLRVTEIMYDPAPPDAEELAEGFSDSDEFEFLEFRNIGTMGIDLGGAEFTSGITFSFGPRVLAPGEIVLLAKNPAAFVARYGSGVAIDGVYSGNLDNGGERLRLRSGAGETWFDFTYDPAWHPLTAGGGRSLVPVDPEGPAIAWETAPGWRPSAHEDGSPGAVDPEPDAPQPPYVSWWLEVFTPLERTDESISGMDADADGDGLVNLIEYVIGTDARKPDPAPVRSVEGIWTRGVPAIALSGDEFRVIFSRRKSSALEGIELRPEFGSSLEDWSISAGAVEMLADDAEFEWVSLPFPAAGSGCFRLSAALSSP